MVFVTASAEVNVVVWVVGVGGGALSVLVDTKIFPHHEHHGRDLRAKTYIANVFFSIPISPTVSHFEMFPDFAHLSSS